MSTENEEIHTVILKIKTPTSYRQPRFERVLTEEQIGNCECNGRAGAGAGGGCACGSHTGAGKGQ